MDPDATWKMLGDSLRMLQKNPQDTEARDQATGCLSSLYNWLDRGGFPPDVMKHCAQMVTQAVLNNPIFKENKE